MRILLAGVVLLGASPRAADDIPAADFARLHAAIKPQAGEWSWARIPWMSDLGAARRRAAAEGKPLYVWTMAGEPLGQC
jgi:hypothetical protein